MRFQTRITALAGGAALALAVLGCDNGLTGINENPNAPTDVAPQLLFPAGVVSSVGLVRGAGFDLHLASLWTQHIGKIQYVDEDKYEIRPQSIDGYWAAFYSGGIQDFTEIITKGLADEDPREFLIAPAVVMKTWAIQQATDVWGDIPYSEANQGDSPTPNFTPVYDAQSDVYAGMLSALADATTMLNTGEGVTYGGSDPLYAGNVAAWMRFSNSLRLRVAMRMSEVAPTAAEAGIQAALAAPAGVFTSNAHNAVLNYPGDGSNDNPWYQNFRTREDHRVSATLIDTLIGLSDPRLPVYAQPMQDETAPDYRGTRYRGIPNGLDNTTAISYGLARTSRPGARFIEDPAAPLYLLTYPEVLFILAEAAERGWIATGTTAAEYYEQGIRASMNMWGISVAEQDAYLASAPGVMPYAGGAAGRAQIAFQKWLALFNQGSEAYAEYRRTNVPALVPGPAAIVSQVATRLTFPVIEESFNNSNLQAAITRMGGNTLTTRVWWDQ